MSVVHPVAYPGCQVWENVWSCWTGITQGDGEAIRRAATILRYFGSKQVQTRA